MKPLTWCMVWVSLGGLTVWNLAQETGDQEPGPALVEEDAPPILAPPVEPEAPPLPRPPLGVAEEDDAAPAEAPPVAPAEPATPQQPGSQDRSAPERARAVREAPAGRPSAPVADRPPARERAGNPPAGTSETERNLRLNFRGAPLELVLDYLSEAAGFIIVLETEVRGKVDVWSNQPLNQTEAVELLNRVLARNGYAALQEGRHLIITTREEAKKRDIPVQAGNNPAVVPRSEAFVTQIIPVRFINAVQLARDLQPLFPPSATIASNEGGNALVVTDSLINIRRIMEIVRALDTSLASVSTVRVFPLRYADAKELATVVRDLFSSAAAGGRGGNQPQQQIIFRGFRGGPAGFGGNNGNQQTASGNGRVPPPQVVAVADERSNSLVVSAPEDQMPLIADLIEQVDVSVEDVTELRVFRLRYADAQETADLLTSLFPDPTTQNRGQGGNRFGGFRPPRFQPAGTQQPSERVLRQSRVVAVADPRTQSVVVSASREVMDQIAVMIAQLDSDPARKQRVYTFSVENTDPAAVEEILRGLFETQNTRNRAATTRNTRQAGSQLNTRAVNTMQNQGRTATGSGFGAGGATGFGTGGAGR